MNELELTDQQLKEIVEFTQSIETPTETTMEDMAFALRFVSLCMLRLQVGPIPSDPKAIDEWYDLTFGNNMRVEASKLIKPLEQLRRLQIIKT